MIEKELKFRVNNLNQLVKKLKGVKPKIFYVKDEVFGKDDIEYKIRKRTKIGNNGIKVSFEKTTPIKREIKTVKEERVDGVPEDFECGCSYEKIRYLYRRNNCDVTIDIYPIGIFCEIEGDEDKIRETADYLGFDEKDNIKKNADTLYCEWAKGRGKEPLFNWGFGKLL